MNASSSTPAHGPEIPAADGPASDSPGFHDRAADSRAADHSAADSPAAGDPAPSVGDAAADAPVRELADIPAVEVITRAAVMLMSAAAEKLGLAEDGDRYSDRDEARRLITALAGLYAAAGDDLGAHRRPIADALRGLQGAFRDASPIPDPPGQGPGETLRRPPPL